MAIIKQIPPQMISGKTYFADEEGNIYNATGHRLSPDFSPASQTKCYGGSPAYPKVTIAGKKRLIHVLVCAAFWGAPLPGQECHHFDGNKLNNRPTNLIFLSHDDHRNFDKAMRAGKRYHRLLTDPEGTPILTANN